GPRSRRRDRGGSHLPPGPRLRTHGRKIVQTRCRYPAPTRKSLMSTVSAHSPLTLALSKGRIFEETLPLLEAAGVEVKDDPERSRKLILDTTRPDLRIIIVRASDVPTYVQYGAADF